MQVFNRSLSSFNDGAKKGVRLSEGPGDGVAYLAGIEFTNGAIEFDVKGKDVQQQSFVGVALHGLDDKTYDAIYFRPFNFKTEDAARRVRAVQYIAHPTHTWQKLRAEQPGQYEQAVNPVPDPNDWFHVRVVVASPKISVYVNDAKIPCLEINQLSDRKKGLVGLWVGNNSGGDFANFKIAPAGPAPSERVSFATQDGGLIYANLYGKGERGVVLAHGGRFNKESWEPQAQVLVKAGYRVLALDLRGYGQSQGSRQADPVPFHYDVLAAVRYLRKAGAKTVSVVGGSLGGGAGADATIEAAPGEIERLVLLGTAAGEGSPEKIKGRKLVIVTRNDTSGAGLRLPGILADYERIPQPKKMVLLEGSAHAQFMFDTELSERVMSEILRFLSAR